MRQPYSRLHTFQLFWMLGILCLFSVVACAPPPPPPTHRGTTAWIEFRDGVQQIAQGLLSQFDTFQYQQERQAEQKQPPGVLRRQVQGAMGNTPAVAIHKTVIDPFRVVETGEVLKITASIEILLKQMLGQKLGIFPMTPDNLRDAAYVINGVIALESHATAPQKKYRISASLFEHTTGLIIGNSQVCVNSLDYQPLDIYKDSPVYIKDRNLDSLVSSVKRSSGERVDPQYLAGLTVGALLREGDALYGNHEYQEALPFYEEAERRPDGKTMKVYAGLYNLYRLRQDAAQSESAFGRLVEGSVAEKNAITVKLLFAVNVAQFIDKPDTVREYTMWLRQISQYVARTPAVCLDIVGHASRSGSADYHERLSALLALFVQSLMQKTYPGMSARSKPIGMGFKQHIVGGGSDDVRDEIDRRVEFLLRAC